MPVDYLDDDNSDLIAEINKQQPYPAGFITMAAPVDAQGERYRTTVEFDLTSPDAYAVMVAKYSSAWPEYYGTSAPQYSPAAAAKLQEAIKFWLYINDGEVANVDFPTNLSHEDVTTSTEGGIVSLDENFFRPSPRVSPYTQDGGSTYENPNAVHDQAVFDNVTSGGLNPLPKVTMNSEKLISGRKNASLYSAEQQSMREYQVSKAAPKSPYDYGGPYNTGGNTY
jgi:hypothetical protein